LIDDDDVDRKAVSRALRSFRSRYDLREARDGRTGLALARSKSFDCILVDYNLPDISGFELLDALQNDGSVVPIVFLTGSGNEAVAVEAMKRGALDYLQKSELKPEILARTVDKAVAKSSLRRTILAAHDTVERLALYDGLTGLGNRNLFEYHLPVAIAIAQREGSTFPLLFMDLDRFKSANDAFGHETGDAILADVGYRLRRMSRGADAFFRIGGDEFTAILHPGSDGAAAARRIVAAIGQPFEFGAPSLDIGISVGVADYPVHGANVLDLVRSADGAMYKAKKARLGWAAADDVPVSG
jgi:diguanylate cyclase (GGDEF)-like protein